MADKRIEVLAYAGYRGEETPRAFFLDGERIEILEIVERWVEEGLAPRGRRRCFRVKGSDRRSHILCYAEAEQAWSAINGDGP